MGAELRFHRLVVLIGACVLVALGISTASASAAALGPAPTVCNAYAPVPNCYYAAVSGTDTFTISSHFVHPGQVITGTYKWEIGGQGNGEFASVGSVAVDAYGQGLKLLGCNGPMHASNGKAAWHTPHAFDVTKGHTTCRWRARFGTGWSVDLGLVVAAGGGDYKAGDYYAVDSKQTALEGTIRFRNDRNSPPTTLGVPGAKVHISGPGGQYNAAANGDGYWYVLLNRGGSFKVDPIIPRKYQIGNDYVAPKVDHVSVANGGIGKSKSRSRTR